MNKKQWNLFVNQIFFDDCLFQNSTVEHVPSTIEKGRITSLEREKSEGKTYKRNYPSIELGKCVDDVMYAKMSKWKLRSFVSNTGKRIFRGIKLEELQGKIDELIRGQDYLKVTVEEIKKEELEVVKSFHKYYDKTYTFFRLIFCMGGVSVPVISSLEMRIPETKEFRWTWLRDNPEYSIYYANLEEILVSFLIIRYLNRKITYICEMDEAERMEDVLHRKMMFEHKKDVKYKMYPNYEVFMEEGEIKWSDVFFIKEHKSRLFPRISWCALTKPVLERFIKYCWIERMEEEEDYKYEKQLSGEYAKSYQTKRNIPQKILDKMENSVFRDYFSFVEIDEDCDLDKIEIIEQNWSEFVKFLSLEDMTVLRNNTLRFRKLGQHRASGLYYPFYRSLCVDIRTPSSFVHELGHLLDYELGRYHKPVSSGYQFNHIYERYEKKLKEAVACGKISFKKGKYNLNYYLRKTEVFARMFELYCLYEWGYADKASILCNEDELNENIYLYHDEQLVSDSILFFNKMLKKEEVHESA